MERQELEHVKRLERALLEPGVRGDRPALEQMLAPAFAEVGASGRMYSRDTVIEAIAGEPPHGGATAVSELAARPLGGDHVLLTYRSHEAGRPARRSSVWERTADGWQLVYHQGTPMPPSGAN